MDDGVPADDSSDALSGSLYDDEYSRSLHSGSQGQDESRTQSNLESTQETAKDSDEGNKMMNETEDDDIKQPAQDLQSSKKGESVKKEVESEDKGSAKSEVGDEAVLEDLSSSSMHGQTSSEKEERVAKPAEITRSTGRTPRSIFSRNSEELGEDSIGRPPDHERDSISERLMIDGVMGSHPVYSNTSFRRGSMEGSVISGNRFRTPSEEERLAGMLQNALDVDELLSDLNEMDHAYLESIRPRDNSSIHSTDFSLSQADSEQYKQDLENQMGGSEDWDDVSQVSMPVPTSRKKKKTIAKMTKPSMFRPHSSSALPPIDENKRAEKKIAYTKTYTKKKVVILVMVVFIAGGSLATIIIFLVKFIQSKNLEQPTNNTAIGESRKLVDYYVVRT
mmetsp:Transcript_22992/g.34868  ORF Transcript_22992/g.34868 Transcript_22992/m.34868 type:complete len:392 (+) Transcript_22992:158-1333(+)